MRSAKIGTIMPWGGDGGTGFLESNIPKGWITCSGQTLSASDYPLLAAALGDSYGGKMTDAAGNHEEFPYYGTDATFGLPNISAKVLIDLERSYLTQDKYKANQTDPLDAVYNTQGDKLGDLIDGYGQNVLVNTTYQATCDIDFTLNLSGNLYFKFDNITMGAPDFLETVYTLNRKLGMNHTPSHSHSDSIMSVNPNPTGPMVFRTDRGIDMTGTITDSTSCRYTKGPIECQNKEAEPTQWFNGATEITYYGDNTRENTLPRMDKFYEFVQDSSGKDYWGFIPAGKDNWPTTDREQLGGGTGPTNLTWESVMFERGNTASFTTEHEISHKTPCHTGMFPKPMRYQGKTNFLGYDTGAPIRSDGLEDDPETSPVFTVSGVTIAAQSNKITLPSNTNISRLYTAGTETWYQYDKITPLMVVVPVNADNKYHYFEEGTYVQSVENKGTEAAPIYELTLNVQVKNSGTIDLAFKNNTWPTTMNVIDTSKDPKEQVYRAHNHGSFEISQGIGSIASPPSHTANDADGSALTADSLEDALNITVDTTQPNVTMTFIIKAY